MKAQGVFKGLKPRSRSRREVGGLLPRLVELEERQRQTESEIGSKNVVETEQVSTTNTNVITNNSKRISSDSN